jgi:hypothetical protein
MLERVLNPEQLDQWFDTAAKAQYTRDLLFLTLFDLMSQVVQGSQRSVHVMVIVAGAPYYALAKEREGAPSSFSLAVLNGHIMWPMK